MSMKLELSKTTSGDTLKVIIEDNSEFITGEDLLEMFISAARATTYNENVITDAICEKANNLKDY